MASAAMIHFGLDPGKRVHQSKPRGKPYSCGSVGPHEFQKFQSHEKNPVGQLPLQAHVRQTPEQQIHDDRTQQFQELQ